MYSVIVFVEGGVVQSVVTDESSIDVFVLDLDGPDPEWGPVVEHDGNQYQLMVFGDYVPYLVRDLTAPIEAALKTWGDKNE